MEGERGGQRQRQQERHSPQTHVQDTREAAMGSPPPEQAAGSFLPSPTHRPPLLKGETSVAQEGKGAPLRPRRPYFIQSSSSLMWMEPLLQDQRMAGWASTVLCKQQAPFTECLHLLRGGMGPRLAEPAKKDWTNWGRLLDPRREGAWPAGEPGCRLTPDPMHASHWPRGEADAGIEVGGLRVPAKRGQILCELRGFDTQGWTTCQGHSSTSPGSVSPPAPQCMLPPCPWRGQDIERRSTVYTFQNGQPCRVMGQSDRVTRQARILPRVLKGDIP